MKRFDLPNVAEQMQLRDNNNLMSTALHHAQMKEMISEVHHSGSTSREQKAIQIWLSEFLPQLNAVEVPDQLIGHDWLKRNNFQNITLEEYNGSSELQFLPPNDDAKIIGSYSLHVMTKPFFNIDIAVTMPEECLDKRDILNHVYFDKRKLYLSALLLHIRDSCPTVDSDSLALAFLKGDDRKPIIIFKPKLKTSYVVRVHVVPSTTSFKLSQLRPTKNNVRPIGWMQSLASRRENSNKSEELPDPTSLQPTPNYNMAVLEDVAAMYVHDLVLKATQLWPILQEILVVVKVWLTQRGLRFGVDSFDGHLAGVLLSYLAYKGLISAKMSVLSGFMAFLAYIGSDNLFSSPLSFADQPSRYEGNSQTLFHASLTVPVTDFDFSSKTDYSQYMFYNVFWRLSASAIDQLHEHARCSLQILQNTDDVSTSLATSSFSKVFLSKSNFFSEYDVVFKIPVVSANSVKEVSEKLNDLQLGDDMEFISQLGHSVLIALNDFTGWQYTSRTARKLITAALGDRASCIHVHSCPFESENCRIVPTNQSTLYPKLFPFSSQSNSQLNCLDGVNVTVGVRFSEDQMRRRVDRGPSADDEEGCAEFRHFWGRISQLRRFKDGSIREAVVWDTDDSTNVKCVRPEKLSTDIVNHIISRHMPFNSYLCGQIVQNISDQLHHTLPGNVGTSQSDMGLRDAPLLFKSANECLDVLRRMITSELKQFPLVIDSLRATHPALRYTSYYPPMKHPMLVGTKEYLNAYAGKNVNRLVEAIPIVATFQKSSKWPSDLEALLSMKSALIIHLSECLKSQFKVDSVVHRDSLDICFQGYLFRLHPFTDHETYLHSGAYNVLHSTASIPQSTRNYIRRMTRTPLHHAAVHSLCSQFSAFGDSVRLLKHWCDSHMLSGYIDHELLELIVASVFLNSDSFWNSTPASSLCGFHRSLIRLAEHKWMEFPLIVDFSGADKIEEHHVDPIYRQFRESRELTNYAPCINVAARYETNDGFSFDYGLNFNDKSILTMVMQMAKKSIDKIQMWMYCMNKASESVNWSEAVMKPKHSLLPKFSIELVFQRSLQCRAKGDLPTDLFQSAIEGPPQCQVEVFSNISLSKARGQSLVCCNESLPHPFQEEVVSKLRSRFGHLALFFYNHQVADKIGVVWKPTAFIPSNFSILQSRHHVLSQVPHVSKDLMVLNIPALIGEMLAVAEGKIDSVSVS